MINNDDLAHLLLSDEEKNSEYDLEDVLLGNKNLNLRGHIFNHAFIDNTVEKAETFIYIESILSTAPNSNTQCLYIVIDVVTHRDLLDLSDKERHIEKQGYAGSRIDIILDMIDRMFLNQSLGIGTIQRKPTNPMSIVRPSTYFYGKEMIYYVSDFTGARNG